MRSCINGSWYGRRSGCHQHYPYHSSFHSGIYQYGSYGISWKYPGRDSRKKAGIIKPDSHMVTVKQQPEAETVIRRVCEEQNVPYEVADRDCAKVLEASITGQTFLYKDEVHDIPGRSLPERKCGGSASCTGNSE